MSKSTGWIFCNVNLTWYCFPIILARSVLSLIVCDMCLSPLIRSAVSLVRPAASLVRSAVSLVRPATSLVRSAVSLGVGLVRKGVQWSYTGFYKGMLRPISAVLLSLPHVRPPQNIYSVD